MRRFSRRSTAIQVVGDRNLTGRRFFITGCNTGVGFQTVRALYNAGGTVTLACRNPDKMSAAVSSLESDAPPGAGKLETILLDLSKQASVRQCAEEFLQRRDDDGAPLAIDTLICNGAVMDVPYSATEDGFELTMATNHFGHFTLTLLLLPRIRRRTVHVASMAHAGMAPRMDLENLNFKLPNYDGFRAYGQSKLANVLFAKELNRRLSDSSVECFSLHPGIINTDLGRYSSRTANILSRSQSKNVEQGAATSVFAALDDVLDGKGGAYLSDCWIATPSGQARNENLQRGLFLKSEELTGTRFAATSTSDAEI